MYLFWEGTETKRLLSVSVLLRFSRTQFADSCEVLLAGVFPVFALGEKSDWDTREWIFLFFLELQHKRNLFLSRSWSHQGFVCRFSSGCAEVKCTTSTSTYQWSVTFVLVEYLSVVFMFVLGLLWKQLTSQNQQEVLPLRLFSTNVSTCVEYQGDAG